MAEKLIRAGAIVLGKTNMHELAFGITSNNAAFGPARNAYDPSRIAGGSSGGTASAIAARMAPAGLGTDTGGSVRIPAALNGIAGLRPTLGRYSQEGITPIAHTRDTAGPMAREVADLVLLDTIITRARDRVTAIPLEGLRLGVCRALFFRSLDPSTEQLADAALDRLRAAGAELVDVDMPGLVDLNGKISFPVALYEARADLTRYLKRYRLALDVASLAGRIASPDVKGSSPTRSCPGPRTRSPRRSTWRRWPRGRCSSGSMRRPSGSTTSRPWCFPPRRCPPRRSGTTRRPCSTGPRSRPSPRSSRTPIRAATRGSPGLSVPIGRTAAGLPVGLELDGPAGSDRRLLGIGLALETLFGRLPAP